MASLTPADIIKAVDKFLAGSWASRSEVFTYATTHALRPITLVEELERQADRLEKAGIRLESWGHESVSERLRQLLEIVAAHPGCREGRRTKRVKPAAAR
ncbi:hypothetical protein GCM10010372_75680 [Streptomyces tauricus]|uniref:hypothetical protein n=1 Tax=Streptomyces tauricus TaxID=68274 RepID=UPI0016761AC7|nr:hypothetical protein [Streptomyces tauricus]GHA64816.1 hypothetical protein GCM10010372_75680 [Streptomyces tauricus]